VELEEDFRAFVSARENALRRAAWLLTGDVDLAKDLVQTALMKSWPHWSKLASRAAAEAYVRRALITTYTSWWRRKWHSEVPSDIPDVPGAALDLDLTNAIRDALLSLPKGQRAAVVLRYFEDLTAVETAALLGCSVGNVKSQTSRALTKLRGNPRLANLMTEGVER
jgi:RNA polymerase sigma-70 factor (sigma-E family)